MKLPQDPAISLLGIYSKEMKSGSQRDICTTRFIAALLTIAKITRQPECPLSDEWINKMSHFLYPVIGYSLKQNIGEGKK